MFLKNTGNESWYNFALMANLNETREWHGNVIPSVASIACYMILRVFTRGRKCTIRMIIWVTVILMLVFWPVCTQISIMKGNFWIAQFKCWSGGVFQWLISQITQRNCRMNALTSKLWFGGWSYVTFYPLPPDKPHIF